MKFAILAPLALVISSCCPSTPPAACTPPTPTPDGWCEVTPKDCPSSAPHAFRLCGTGEKSAPIPSRCTGDVIIAASDGAVCCP